MDPSHREREGRTYMDTMDHFSPNAPARLYARPPPTSRSVNQHPQLSTRERQPAAPLPTTFSPEPSVSSSRPSIPLQQSTGRDSHLSKHVDSAGHVQRSSTDAILLAERQRVRELFKVYSNMPVSSPGRRAGLESIRRQIETLNSGHADMQARPAKSHREKLNELQMRRERSENHLRSPRPRETPPSHERFFAPSRAAVPDHVEPGADSHDTNKSSRSNLEKDPLSKRYASRLSLNERYLRAFDHPSTGSHSDHVAYGAEVEARNKKPLPAVPRQSPGDIPNAKAAVEAFAQRLSTLITQDPRVPRGLKPNNETKKDPATEYLPPTTYSRPHNMPKHPVRYITRRYVDVDGKGVPMPEPELLDNTRPARNLSSAWPPLECTEGRDESPAKSASPGSARELDKALIGAESANKEATILSGLSRRTPTGPQKKPSLKLDTTFMVKTLEKAQSDDARTKDIIAGHPINNKHSTHSVLRGDTMSSGFAKDGGISGKASGNGTMSSGVEVNEILTNDSRLADVEADRMDASKALEREIPNVDHTSNTPQIDATSTANSATDVRAVSREAYEAVADTKHNDTGLEIDASVASNDSTDASTINTKAASNIADTTHSESESESEASSSEEETKPQDKFEDISLSSDGSPSPDIDNQLDGTSWEKIDVDGIDQEDEFYHQVANPQRVGLVEAARRKAWAWIR